MKFTKSPVYIEFKESSVHVLDGEEGIDLPLEREAGGRMTSASVAAVESGIRGFLTRHGWRPEGPALCSIPARGVTLRRLTIPAGARDEIPRLLTLQLEAQLPVSPADLAWGYAHLGTSGAAGATMQEFSVAAVRKEFLEDYSHLLAQVGLIPSFTVAALARTPLINGSAQSCAILEAGRNKSELTVLDQRGPANVRVLSWGIDHAADASALARVLQNGFGQKLYLSGTDPGLARLASDLRACQTSLQCEVITLPAGPGRTGANLGARAAVEHGAAPLLLGGPEGPSRRLESNATWKWAAAAGLLLVLSFFLRYAEAALYRSRIERKLDQMAKYKTSLPRIDREVSFLNFIKTNQPPYLDTLAVLATAAPRGTRIDTVTLVRHGDLSLRGSMMGNPQGPLDFRARLIDSGFFSRVVIEEQTPEQNGQKMNFRISAQLKPDGERKAFSLPPVSSKPAKHPSTNAPPSHHPHAESLPQLTQN